MKNHVSNFGGNLHVKTFRQQRSVGLTIIMSVVKSREGVYQSVRDGAKSLIKPSYPVN